MEEEIWKLIKGYEDSYAISTLGIVYSLRTKVYRKAFVTSGGYHMITLKVNGKCKKISVHIVVAQHFIKNPKKKPEVNHIDGNKINNNISNLEWVTKSENCIHSHRVLQQKSGKVIQKLDEDNNVIEEFKTTLLAGKNANVSHQRISDACKLGKKVSGYHWKYKKDSKIHTPVDTNYIFVADIPDFPDYVITEYGDVYSLKKKIYLEYRENTNGYRDVHICVDGKSYSKLIHILVTMSFHNLKPHPNMQVNHIDGNTRNNHFLNLEWVTASENTIHAIKLGLSKSTTQRKICQYDLKGNFIKQFESMMMASKESGSNISSLVRACQGKCKTSKGFVWKYAEDG